ncbi:MAG: hypothetical protein GKR96_11385 [Gammaproteobacteria bacterium]|nr:hypothetical protein [Gammaproteobacteria bacterium]
MPSLLQTLINICLFKASPQDLPAKQDLLVKVIIATLALFLIRNYYLIGGSRAIAISVTQVFLIGASLRVLLMVFKQTDRWTQAAMSIYGCWSILLVVILPVFMMNSGVEIKSTDLNLTTIMVLATTIWNFAVITRILKETLEINTPLAILINFILELIFSTVLVSLFAGDVM